MRTDEQETSDSLARLAQRYALEMSKKDARIAELEAKIKELQSVCVYTCNKCGSVHSTDNMVAWCAYCVQVLKDKIRELTLVIQGELQDPSGTIWEVAARHKKDNDELKAQLAMYRTHKDPCGRPDCPQFNCMRSYNHQSAYTQTNSTPSAHGDDERKPG